MGKQYSEQLNPSIKLVILFVLMIGLLITHSLIINSVVLVLSIYIYFFKTNISIDEVRSILIKLSCALLCSILITFGLKYFNYQPLVILNKLDLSFAFQMFFIFTYTSTLIIHLDIFLKTTVLFELVLSLTKTLHLPFKIAYGLYNAVVFMENYENEFIIAKNAYKTRGIKISKYSFRAIKLILRNYKRRTKNKEFALNSKGFSNNILNDQVKSKVGLNEIIYILAFVFILLSKLILLQKGITI